MATQIEERAPLGNSCTVSVSSLTGGMLGVCAMGGREPWLALLRRIEATSGIDPATIRLVCNGGIARLDHFHGATNAAVRGQAFVIAIQGPPSCTLCTQAFNSGAGVHLWRSFLLQHRMSARGLQGAPARMSWRSNVEASAELQRTAKGELSIRSVRY